MLEDVGVLINNPSFKNIKEPVALFFSYVDVEKYEFYQKNNFELVNLSSHYKSELIKHLKDNSYLAVSDESTLASHPATIVVSNKGIQTPFLEPDRVKDFIIELLEYINQSKFVMPLSHVIAVRLEQLPAPVISKDNNEKIFTHLLHPDGYLRKYIEYRQGKDFVKRMYKRAWKNGENNEPRKKLNYDVSDMSQDLYSGRKLAIEPYYCYARNDMEARYLVYATPNYNHSAKFCGYDEKSGFGLIHHYGKSEKQEYYQSFAIELGGLPQNKKENQIETIVIPKENEYRGLEMYMKTRSFDIPEDADWEEFKEYCRAAYMPNNENMKNRRINILKEAKENNLRAVTYMPIGLREEDLFLDNFTKKTVTLEDLLIEPQSDIRKAYYNAKLTKSLDNMKQLVQETRKIDNIVENSRISQTEEISSTFLKSKEK